MITGVSKNDDAPGPNSIKGTSVRATFNYIQECFGADAHAAILDQMPEEMAARFRGTVLASSWFSITALTEYLVVADRMYGQSDYALCEAAGRFSAYESLSTVFKFLMKLQSPLGMVARASKMWRHFNSSGNLEVVETKAHQVHVRLSDMPQPHAAHCRRQMGWFARAVEVAGGKEVQVSHPNCRAAGDATCDFFVNWK